MTDRAPFFAELKRRNVHRAAVFYAGAAWLLVQIATQVFPFFHIPEWVVRWIVVAAAIGFPFAMAFSWFYEWTPQGIRRESEIELSDSVKRETGKKTRSLDHRRARSRRRAAARRPIRSAQGNRRAAFEWLDHAYDQHDGGLAMIKYDPFLATLRADPRYAGLVKKMDLPA